MPTSVRPATLSRANEFHLNTPPPPQAPQLVPVEVAFAIYGMWASLLLSAGFAIHEIAISASALDPRGRLAIFAGIFVTIKALPAKLHWARYAAALLTLLFYAFLAFDADGLTNNDFWHMLAKAPIDVFVISRLFKPIVAQWLKEP